MSKVVKIFSIIFIIFSIMFHFYYVSASNIDMNLTQNETAANQTATNEVSDGENATVDDTVPGDTLQDQDPVTPPASVSAIAEEGFGLSNILSILLITVGIVLILLAIAIIMRLK